MSILLRFLLFLFVTVLVSSGGPACNRQPSIEAMIEEDISATGDHTDSPFRFREVTSDAGIRFQHINGAAGELNLPETMGSGCTFLDFDNDGDLDLFFVNGRRLSPHDTKADSGCALYRNNGDGKFADVSRGSGLEESFFGMGCAIGDYDNDGREDIYVTAALDGSRLFHNLGDGKFKEVSEKARVRNAGKWGASCSWLDYDRDGKLDLFVTNYVRYRWGDDKHCANPETHRTYCNPESFPPDTCRLFRNSGDGTFEDVSASTGIDRVAGKPLGVLAIDYDDDGWQDIMVACDTSPNLLFHNSRGRFSEVGLGQGVAIGENGKPRAGMGIDAAYTQNDDRLAVLVSNFANEGLAFFTQDRPSGSFLDTGGSAGFLTTSRLFLGFGLSFLDVDNDGLQDAAVANGHIDPWIGEHTSISHAQRPLLYWNRGAGQFTEVGEQAGIDFRKPRVGRGLAVGDYDGDGRLDIVLSNNGQPATLLRNETTKGNWLQIRLEGARSNRSAIGANVKLRTGKAAQRDWVRGGSSYCSQNARDLHFGLGNVSMVDSVEIRWPSGQVDRHTNLAANRRIRAREGETQIQPL